MKKTLEIFFSSFRPWHIANESNVYSCHAGFTFSKRALRLFCVAFGLFRFFKTFCIYLMIIFSFRKKNIKNKLCVW